MTKLLQQAINASRTEVDLQMSLHQFAIEVSQLHEEHGNSQQYDDMLGVKTEQFFDDHLKALAQQEPSSVLYHDNLAINYAKLAQHCEMLEAKLAQQEHRINVPAAHELAKEQAKTDQTVATEYLAWLESLYPARNGVGGNEAWNAGIAWLKAQQEQPASVDAYVGAREDAAIWKKRALEAEELNRKFIAEVNGPTYLGEPVKQEQPEQEPEAWLIPSLASFKDAKSVSFSRVEGCTLTDAQLIEKMSGEVLWRVEVFSDGDGVIDKHGAHHAPKPLYTRPALTQPEEDFCYCNKNVSLQMVSGGGAPEGYLGMVTLRIGDQYRDYYTHPPTQPAPEPVSTNDMASAYLEKHLWKVIDMAGMWPKAKIDTRTWQHAMVYAPTQPALSDDEILNCFYASKSEGMAAYMLAVGRAIEAHCRGGANK